MGGILYFFCAYISRFFSFWDGLCGDLSGDITHVKKIDRNFSEKTHREREREREREIQITTYYYYYIPLYLLKLFLLLWSKHIHPFSRESELRDVKRRNDRERERFTSPYIIIISHTYNGNERNKKERED